MTSLSSLFSVKILIWAALVFSFTSVSAKETGSSRYMYEQPIPFSGPKEAQEVKPNQVVLGFFLPETDDTHELNKVIIDAAEATVNKANRETAEGPHFTVIHRQLKSAWQDGTGELINMAYRDKVNIIFTGLSTEGHLAAQIAGKVHVPVISIASGDITLNRSGLPWVFRFLPEHRLQLQVLINDMLENSITQIGIFTSLEEESRMAAAEVESRLAQAKIHSFFHLHTKQQGQKIPDILIEKIIQKQPQALLLSLQKNSLQLLLETLEKNHIRIPIYLFFTPAAEKDAMNRLYSGPVKTVSPLFRSDETETEDILYKLTTDAVELIINLVKTSGTDRFELRQALSEQKEYISNHGRYSFDDGGGNIAIPELITYRERQQ